MYENCLSLSFSGLWGPMGTEWRCIKPLTVFTCAGLMLMGRGRPRAAEWEIDQHWMCVRGVLTSTTAFHASRLENPSFKKPHASPDSPHLPHRLIRYQWWSQDTWSALYDRVFSWQKTLCLSDFLINDRSSPAQWRERVHVFINWELDKCRRITQHYSLP